MRKICIYCGRKVYLKKMIFVSEHYGRYYQAGKMIKDYACYFTSRKKPFQKSCYELFIEKLCK